MANRHFLRFQSIDMEPMDDSSDTSNHTWPQDGINSMQLKRSEMNALIMDYLVHEGFKEAAERFKEEAGIQSTNIFINDQQQNIHDQNKPETANSSATAANRNNNNNNNNNNGTDGETSMMTNEENAIIDNTTQPNSNTNTNGFFQHKLYDTDWISKAETPEMMDKRIEVRRLIEDGDILKAQSLINLYYPELLDNQRNLYFRLQQQHLIELIRKQKISEVLTYVHDQLSVDELRDLTEMERTLALLAYDKPDKSPYASLLHLSHRLQLASEMNDRILRETIGYIEPTKPRLVTLLKLLFWTQSELEKKKIQFPKMTDLVNGTIVEPRH